jgi:hypothetical protein
MFDCGFFLQVKMKLCILPVIILVVLLQPEQSRCDPIDVKMGPALRPYNVIPVFHKLAAKIIGNVTPGANVTLQVTLEGYAETITNCQWTSPEGTVYNVNKGNYGDSVNGKLIK